MIKILVGGGITVNLIILKVVKVTNLRLHENDNLCIRVVNGMSILIIHVVRFTIKIIGIDHNIKAFIIPGNVLYSIFFNRP